jgi:hypothetical protein
MKNIGVILRASRSLAEELEPVNISQALNLKGCKPNHFRLLHQYIDVLLRKIAKPIEKL